MAVEREHPVLSYEEGLRVIGRYLDAEPAYSMRLVEKSDGFSVHYQPSQYRSDERILEFSWERLVDLVVLHSSGRGLIRKHGRYQGMWAKFPNGHQGFFRALGFELDQQNGRDLLVQELEDRVVVTYKRPGSDRLGSSEPVEKSYGEPEIAGMVVTAEQRRG